MCIPVTDLLRVHSFNPQFINLAGTIFTGAQKKFGPVVFVSVFVNRGFDNLTGETWRQMSRRNWGAGMACFAKDDQMDRIDPNIYFFALRLSEYSYGYYSLQIYTYIISNTYIVYFQILRILHPCIVFQMSSFGDLRTPRFAWPFFEKVVLASPRRPCERPLDC